VSTEEGQQFLDLFPPPPQQQHSGPEMDHCKKKGYEKLRIGIKWNTP
jgi:hypothetical protein